jgi:tetratricopeptide (TPR) repeat protein
MGTAGRFARLSRRPRSAVFAIVLGLALAATAAGSEEEVDEAEAPPAEEELEAWCEEAEDLLALDLVDRARGRYEKVLAVDPDRPCAVSGLAATAKRYCDNGGVLLGRGLLEEAGESLKKALAIEPRAQCAAAGLAELAERHVALGNALHAAGYAKKAEDEFARALALDPGLRIKDAPSPGFARRWNAFAALGRMAVMSAAPFALLLVLIVALRRLFATPALDILPFDSEAKKDSGKSFAALLRARLLDLAAGRPDADIHLVKGEITGVEIPAEVHTLLPAPATWLAPVVKLVSRLTSRRSLVVGGTLHPTGSWGAGVTLQLTGGRKISSVQTLWLREFQAGPTAGEASEFSDYCYLADLASVWLLFTLFESLGKNHVELLGTKDWKSYALFRAATFAHSEQHLSAARDLYCRALARDPGLRGARVNLAQILVETG